MITDSLRDGIALGFVEGIADGVVDSLIEDAATSLASSFQHSRYKVIAYLNPVEAVEVEDIAV